MLSFILSGDQMESFIEKLCETHTVHEPVRKGVECSFERVTFANDLWLDYHTTVLPPKNSSCRPAKVNSLSKVARSRRSKT